jgi:hypothetical protein
VKSGIVRRGKEIREGLDPIHAEMAIEEIWQVRDEFGLYRLVLELKKEF